MPSRPDPKETEAALFGEGARYTRGEAVERAGASAELAANIWRALGFVAKADDAVSFTDSDVEALRVATELVRQGKLTEDAAVRMARALGQTTARLAEWQTSVLSTLADAAGEDETALPTGSLADRVAELAPDMEHLLTHVWRRQLAAATQRALALRGDNEERSPNYFPLAVGFADLVSFTTLSRELDEVGLAEVVESFEASSADVVASGGGRVVKMLGDEILFVANTAPQAADIALRLADEDRTRARGPEVRVGLAYGPVLALLGDVFGTTVNRASRLTSFARPGTVLGDAALAELLEGDPAYQVMGIRARHAHGLGQLQPYALRRSFEYMHRP